MFDLGINVQENSELDLLVAYRKHADDPRIPEIIADMEKEMGAGNKMPGILPRLAQYEATLIDWMEENLGASDYAVFANKCWPRFKRNLASYPVM